MSRVRCGQEQWQRPLIGCCSSDADAIHGRGNSEGDGNGLTPSMPYAFISRAVLPRLSSYGNHSLEESDSHPCDCDKKHMCTCDESREPRLGGRRHVSELIYLPALVNCSRCLLSIRSCCRSCDNHNGKAQRRCDGYEDDTLFLREDDGRRGAGERARKKPQE
jgi:hypothetical protein